MIRGIHAGGWISYKQRPARLAFALACQLAACSGQPSGHEQPSQAIAKPRAPSGRHPVTADHPEEFEGEWSYRSDCDQGHYVTLNLENKNDLLIGSWSDGTQLHGSQGLLKGHVKQGRLVAEWCGEDEQAVAPALCSTYEESDDYLVARDGMLVWYQKYGQDHVKYVVLKQGSVSHQPMEVCDEDKQGVWR